MRGTSRRVAWTRSRSGGDRGARVARPALASVSMGVPTTEPPTRPRETEPTAPARAPSRGRDAAADVGGRRSASASPLARAAAPRGAAGVERLDSSRCGSIAPAQNPNSTPSTTARFGSSSPRRRTRLASIRAGEGKTKAKRSAPASSSPSSSSDPSDASDAVPEWVALQRRRADRFGGA